VQFWDGRAPTVEEQAKGPILNPVEMAMPNEKRALAVVDSMPEYVRGVSEGFPRREASGDLRQPGQGHRRLRAQVGDGIALGQVPGRRPGGAHRRGKDRAEQVFWRPAARTVTTELIWAAACSRNWAWQLPWDNANDPGRFAVTKTGSRPHGIQGAHLRNVEKTAPYFHDGSIATLDEAVRQMANHQLARTLSKEEADSIATF